MQSYRAGVRIGCGNGCDADSISIKRVAESVCDSIVLWCHIALLQDNPGIERVQELTDISRSALCCHSNETHAPIANLPNSAQLEGTPTIPPSYIRVSAVVWECSEGQTDRHTTVVSNIFCLSYASCEI